MKLQNHTIAENGDVIFDGKYNMNELHLYTDAELDYIEKEAHVWASINMAMSASQKVMMNAIYGATANKYFYFASFESADDITAEGRHYVKLGEKTVNEYFKFAWHLDTELHNHLRNHEKLKNSFDPNKTTVDKLDEKDDYIIYIDTDSLYVTFEFLFKSIGFDPKKEDMYADFIMIMNEFRLKGLFEEKLSEDVLRRHGENFLKFDLESVSETAIYTAKKKYVMSYKMEDGNIYDDPLKHIKVKGLELARSSMSAQVKEMIKFVITQIFREKINNLNYKTYMRHLYKQFCELPVQSRCELGNCKTYEKYVVDDVNEIKLNKGATANVKGIANYNFDVNKHGLKTKYELIRKEKIAWYYTTDMEKGSYAFPIDGYPEEIAPPVDNNRQFSKLVADPIARIASCAGIDTSNPLSSNITVSI